MLKQSVLKHVRRRPEGVKEGAAIGYDAAIFQNKGDFLAQATGAMSSGWFAEGASVTAGEAAWITAENQLAMAGAVPVGAEILLTMGKNCPEGDIRKVMQGLNAFAAERNIPVLGGNTVHFGTGSDFLIQVVMTGYLEKAQASGLRKPQPGDRVYLLGETGSLGAELLVAAKKEQLKSRFAESYMETMRYRREDFSCKENAFRALQAGAVYLHDVSYGGVYAALYQIAEAAASGIAVRHEGLTIRQSVIELTEELGVNPYQLLGTGGCFAVVPEDRAEAWETAMQARSAGDRANNGHPEQSDGDRENDDHPEQSAGDRENNGHPEQSAGDRVNDAHPVRPGVQISYVGRITAENARVVRAEGYYMERSLNLPEGDAAEDLLNE